MTEQSGIKAGDGGFNVHVAGDTNLIGGVIESTQAAVDAAKNSFSTTNLTITDIVNVDEQKGGGWSFSASSDGTKPNGSSAGISDLNERQESVTRSGISGIAGDDSVRTGDNSSVGALANRWNEQQAMQDLAAQQQITAAFGSSAAKAIGDYARQQHDAALARNDPEEAAKWAEGGEYRLAAHAAAGALTGGFGVALAAGTSAALMPTIGEEIANLDLPEPVKQALGVAMATAIGGIVGGPAGAGNAYNIDANNRQLHPTEAKIIKDNAKRFAQQLYGTENPTAEQIDAAGAMLANTAQSKLDNNLGYTVPYSEAADSFLQTLKIEYMQQNGTLVLPDTQGTQQLFYATVDQKNNPSLNQGLADSSVTGLIVRTPLSASYNNPTNDPGRDKLTGLPLDDQGRYTVQYSVEGQIYSPKYYPCATTDCVVGGKNLDMSDPATQAYVKAVDKMIVDDINKQATIVTLISPVGVAGTIAGVLGPITSVVSGAMSDQTLPALAKETIQYAATQYVSRIYGLGEAAANRIAAAVDLAGGWQAFVDRATSENGGAK